MKFSVYYPTWNSPWVNDSSKMDLSSLKDFYNGSLDYVYLSFCKPDLVYKRGQNTWLGTGMEFSMEFGIVKEAIKKLQSAGVKVLIAVGGSTYWGDDGVFFNAVDLISLVLDLGVDGIDLDYEVTGNGKKLTSAALSIYPLLKNNEKLLSAAVFSTGAYASNGGWSGMNLDLLTTAGNLLNFINIMAYDAGPPEAFDPIESFKAYRKIYNGEINMGFLIGNPGWGGYLLKEEDVYRNSGWVSKNGSVNDGVFLWAHRNVGNVGGGRVFEIAKSFSAPIVDSEFLKILKGDFVLNGKKFSPVGINAYWLGIGEDYSYPSFEQIEEMFIAVKRMGGNTIRSHTIGHSSGHPNSLLPVAGRSINEKAWPSIDYAFSMAKKYNVKIIAPLTDSYNWYNGNYGDYCSAAGVSKEQFFTSSAARSFFKNYIWAYLNHYNPLNGCMIKDDPCLAVIELCNELGNIRPPSSVAIPTNEWLKDMAVFLKSVDKNHLIVCPTDESLGLSGEFDILEFDCFRGDYYWADFTRYGRNYSKSKDKGKPFICTEVGVNVKGFLPDLKTGGLLLWGMYPHVRGINGGPRIEHNDGYTIHYDKDNEEILLEWCKHFANVTGEKPVLKLDFGPAVPVVPVVFPPVVVEGITCPNCNVFYQRK